ncbi:MAG: CrcB family protein [Halodesulfurarchaeum sp.]|nr:CrcB family protein [Halodesulfurarchaeum sp.]
MTARDFRPIRALETMALVGIGGFAGSNLRYLIGQFWPALPATLAVNTTGSFALGLVIYVALRTDRLSMETRLLVSTGFLSSFTTYSTFALLSVQSQPAWFVFNVLATYGLGFAGVIVGRAVAVRFEGRVSR